MLASLFTRQLIFDGLTSGLVFGLLAMGIVLIYRSTRVINFAVGNMGLVGAGLFALLVVQYNVPYWLGVIAGLVAGTLYGAVIELTVIRRLFTAPRVIVLVATIGIAQLSQVILLSFPEIDVKAARFPTAIGGSFQLAKIQISGPQLVILLMVPATAVGLAMFLNHTTFGKSVRASAENPDLARLAGVSPKRVSLFVWAVAGALSTLSISLIAANTGSATSIALLGPSTLVRALVAAVLAGMVSFPRAFFAGVAIGILQSLIAFNFYDQQGLIDFLILIAVLVAVSFQGRTAKAETRTFSFAPKRRPIPVVLRSKWWVRQVDRSGFVVLGLCTIALPIVVTQSSRHLLYTVILVFALCGMSLTILTGWAGQLSLGQMAFAGIGAMLTATFNRGLNVDIGWGDHRFLKAGIDALPAGPSIVLAVLLTATLAAVIGLDALRIQGLMLAVSTFAFALAASQYLYRRPILSGGFNGSIPLRRTTLFGLDISNQRTFYYVTLAALAVATFAVGRLRRTGVGRTTIGVRDNPDGASAYTIKSSQVKLSAFFAMAGGIATLGGALLAFGLQTVPADRFFTVQDSLSLVSIVVIGGLGSVAGPILGSLWVIGLPAFFPGNDIVPLLSSSVGLLVLLLYFPGGLVQLGHSARDALFEWMAERATPVPAKRRLEAPTSLKRPERKVAASGVPVLRTTAINVSFDGIKAVTDVTIEVRAHEVIGLIGTNGAGKSTLMNAIGGFVRSTGEVELLGEVISGLSTADRARAGLGRTFQSATLFPELTIRETVQLALEAQYRTRFLPSALCLPGSLRTERIRRREADELIDFLGLGRYAEAYISDLSTGTRRIVELAGLLALGSTLLCLDEPTAGLAQRETEAAGPLIQEISRELNASVLVVEHDMPLIMGISDRVYCLDLGVVIAEGTPAEVRSNPLVISSYLGTDDRAIERSGPTATTATTVA